MADPKSIKVPPGFLPFKPVPAVLRGQPHHIVGAIAFTSFRLAVCAGSAAECHRLNIVDQLDTLIAQRAVALTEMRVAGDDFAAFSAASKREAHLAAQIRQLRRQGGES